MPSPLLRRVAAAALLVCLSAASLDGQTNQVSISSATVNTAGTRLTVQGRNLTSRSFTTVVTLGETTLAIE